MHFISISSAKQNYVHISSDDTCALIGEGVGLDMPIMDISMSIHCRHKERYMKLLKHNARTVSSDRERTPRGIGKRTNRYTPDINPIKKSLNNTDFLNFVCENDASSTF